MTNFSWFILNIGVPVLGPIFMLALVSPSYGRSVAWRMIIDSVKDGQLFWAAIALSASALYEIYVAKAKSEATAAVAAAQATSHSVVQNASAAVQAAAGSQEPTAGFPPMLALQISIAIFVLIAIASALMVMLVGIKAYHDRREADAVAAAVAAAGTAQAAAVTSGGATGQAGTSAAGGASAAPSFNANLKISIVLTIAAATLFSVMHIWIG